METQQSFSNGLRDPAAHGLLVMEFHFAFRRVDIDIDRRRIDFQKEAAHRVTAFHERGVIAFQ